MSSISTRPFTFTFTFHPGVLYQKRKKKKKNSQYVLDFPHSPALRIANQLILSFADPKIPVTGHMFWTHFIYCLAPAAFTSLSLRRDSGTVLVRVVLLLHE
jgi:hypothetical protein